MTEYSSYSSTVSESTPAAGLTAKSLPGMIKCYIYPPEVLFTARVNLASAVYPIGEIPYDTVTIGTYDLVKEGMTFFLGSTAGATDLGRGRIRLDAISGTLYINRASKGVREGEATVNDNAYITVINLYRIHSKMYYITDAGVQYKDGYITYTDQNDEMPPVSNLGPPRAGTIDSTSGYLRCEFNGLNSIAMADGATITDYLWDIEDEIIVSGAVDEDTIEVDFQPGFHYVTLTVTDSNGKTHTARTYVFAHDSDMREDIQEFEITDHKITQSGQEIEVRVFDDLPLATYPEGTIVILWEGEPASTTDYTNVLFNGWLYNEPISQKAERTGFTDYVTFGCVDTAGMMKKLPALSQILSNELIRDAAIDPAVTWEYMPNPNLNKYAYYLLKWHSTVLDLADFFIDADGDEYFFPVLGSDAQNLYDQVNQRCLAFVPDRVLTCNRNGQLRILVDPMLQEVADRTAIEQAELTLDDWSTTTYTRQTKPIIHWLHADAIRVHTKNFESYFSVAPGDAPGQGETAQTNSEQLARSQDDLNKVTGHRYARINAPTSKYSVMLAEGDGLRIEPADMTWVRVTTLASQRVPGSTFSLRGLPIELNIEYDYNDSGLVRTVIMQWEREVSGYSAITYVPPVAEEPDEEVINPDLPDYTDPVIPDLFYDNPGAYLMWDGAVVLRTFDIMATSPVWENISTGLPASGIMDVRYSNTTTTVIGWVLNVTGVYVCMDLLATTPTWSLILDINTILTDDVAPAVGVNTFNCMITYAQEPGYLLVATGPDDWNSPTNIDYANSYFRHTHNYGATWTTVDAGATLQRTVITTTQSFCHGQPHSIEMMREEPTILCARTSILYVANIDTKMCISYDGGHTWALSPDDLSESLNNGSNAATVLHPFPAFNRWSYCTIGNVGSRIKRSDDLWATNEELYDSVDYSPSILTDYEDVNKQWRPNKNPYDNNHLVNWFKYNADNTWHLLETTDSGVTWVKLYESGITDGSPDNLPSGVDPTLPSFSVPNGWPVDINMWWIVRNQVISGSPTGVIKMTIDNWANTLDKVGNLASVLPAGLWTDGPAGGFALPKVGINA